MLLLQSPFPNPTAEREARAQKRRRESELQDELKEYLDGRIPKDFKYGDELRDLWEVSF